VHKYRLLFDISGGRATAMASHEDEFILIPRLRLSFQEMMELTPVTAASGDGLSNTKRFLSRRQAWKLGPDLAWKHKKSVEEDPRKSFGRGAYGGHVYIQAPLAAARVVEKEDELTPAAGKLGIHVSTVEPNRMRKNILV
jgi:hypothetical protein